MGKRDTVRFETEPGRQAQVDWAEFGRIELDGEVRSLYATASGGASSAAIIIAGAILNRLLHRSTTVRLRRVREKRKAGILSPAREVVPAK